MQGWWFSWCIDQFYWIRLYWEIYKIRFRFLPSLEYPLIGNLDRFVSFCISSKRLGLSLACILILVLSGVFSVPDWEQLGVEVDGSSAKRLLLSSIAIGVGLYDGTVSVSYSSRFEFSFFRTTLAPSPLIVYSIYD